MQIRVARDIEGNVVWQFFFQDDIKIGDERLHAGAADIVNPHHDACSRFLASEERCGDVRVVDLP